MKNRSKLQAKDEHGFTLIEIALVIGIIAITTVFFANTAIQSKKDAEGYEQLSAGAKASYQGAKQSFLPRPANQSSVDNF